MAEKKIARKGARRSPSKTTATKKKYQGFSAEERAAMKERSRELKAEASKADGERQLLAKIAEMASADRTLAKRIHAIVTANAPDLAPKTWYGMPAYANQDGKIICFFKAASKDNERYATFGFDMAASIDEGNMWPTAFGLTKLTDAEEKKIAALVKKAVSRD